MSELGRGPRTGFSGAGVARRMASAIVLILLWWLVATAFTGIRVLPTPWAVARAFGHDLPVYWENVRVTLTNAAVGYAVGNATAVAFAVAFVQVPWIERLLLRIAIASYCVPLVAITPILVVVLPGDAPKQALAAISVFFTTLTFCVLGLQSTDSAAADVLRSMGGTDWHILRKVQLSSMLPALFTGLQIAAPAAILGTILGEYMGASTGLGVLLVQAQSSFEVAQTWSTALLISLLSALVFLLIGRLGRMATPWVGKEVSIVAATIAVRRGRLWTALLGLVGSVLIVVVAWWTLIWALGLDRYFAKTPLDVGRHLASPGVAHTIGSGLLVTLRDAAVGYCIGIALACLLAVSVVLFPLADRLVMPMAVVARSIPLVALTPLIAFVFGRGVAGVTVVVSLMTFFPTLVGVAAGMRNAPELACDVVRSMGGNDLHVTYKIRLRYALPGIFAAAKMAAPGAIAGATLAEWLATGRGTGSMLIQDYAASRFSALWAESVCVVGVSVLAYTMVSALERRSLGHGR